mmetsp:Transcript_17567/g.42628  ORF Transcript_17567/g.42628 Transcript_17567/m.42628 type:complete len:203 (-) Transcript_17567:293-901(-)
MTTQEQQNSSVASTPLPSQLACAACEKKLAVMKRCTRCRCTYYCSRECQVQHWSTHKAECSQTANASSSNLNGASPVGATPAPCSSSNVGREDAAKLVQSLGRRIRKTNCKRCHGSGMVQREEPARVPVASLESGATGFVRRDMNCPDCQGDGIVDGGYSDDAYDMDIGEGGELQRKAQGSDNCFRCQASSKAECSCLPIEA